MADKLERHFLSGHNGVTEQICHRYFGGWNQVVLIASFQPKQVFCELGKLASTQQRLPVHDIGHVHFLISMLARVQVKHELTKRTIKTGNAAAQIGKARARHFRCGFKV